MVCSVDILVDSDQEKRAIQYQGHVQQAIGKMREANKPFTAAKSCSDHANGIVEIRWWLLIIKKLLLVDLLKIDILLLNFLRFGLIRT